ncbi:MAG: MarR family transcriptional regulator [Flavobacterium sp.]
MEKAIHYINKTLGINATVNPLRTQDLGNLPFYITQAYQLLGTNIFKRNIVLVTHKNDGDFSVLQTEKHLQLISTTFSATVVLVLEHLQSYHRKRLIEKGINFIVPEKQLFLPELLIHLTENYSLPKSTVKNKSLMPSSQFLLLYHIIHSDQNWKMEAHSFKEIAQKLDYSPMAVTYAVDDLKHHDLIEVTGEKEKFIKFNLERSALWHQAMRENIMESPVLKTVFVDELPANVLMLKANTSALPTYSSLNPSKQQFYAIEKSTFYFLQKNNGLLNLNDREGKFALEVWKYNPATLIEDVSIDDEVVDPLSLYLSLKNSTDERIAMGLEQIIEKMRW